jgi:ATP-dependent 26S proteasome regulatory subunit
MIAGQMGDTTYRGKIIWMLLTSRPDMLPIDLKRQGRAEVHIPLFYPQDEDEIRAMFLAMARKNKVALSADAVPTGLAGRGLSGSDIESVVLSAKRQALTAGRTDVRADDVAEAFRQFLPSTQGLEKEAQELAAVLECTQLDFLPAHWREKVADRTQLQERFMAIHQLLGK